MEADEAPTATAPQTTARRSATRVTLSRIAGGPHPADPRSYAPARMRIVIVGAGQVGATVVEALHAEHDLSVIDITRERLEALAYRYDVRTIEANGASRKALQDAGVERADLFIAFRFVADLLGQAKGALAAALTGRGRDARGHLAYAGGLFTGARLMTGLMLRGAQK